jgi:hypothetical protein
MKKILGASPSVSLPRECRPSLKTVNLTNNTFADFLGLFISFLKELLQEIINVKTVGQVH